MKSIFPTLDDIRGLRGILLDLDDTLYDYGVCHEHALHASYRAFKKICPVSFTEFSGMYSRAKKRVSSRIPDHGSSHSRLLYFQALFEALYGRTETGLTLRFERVYWRAFFSKMRLRAGALDFLKSCKARGLKICIVTDLTSEVQFRKIRKLGIGRYVDFVVSSEEAGREKPAPTIFCLALLKLAMKPREVILIGDDTHRDLRGGMGIGIKTYLLGT